LPGSVPVPGALVSPHLQGCLVLDFMPIERPETPTDRHRLVRVVRVVRGAMRSSLEGAPRFD